MAGGMILMAVYTGFFPVELAMIFHGFTQLLANGQRVVLWRKHLFWKILGAYFIGSLVSVLIFRAYSFVPDKALIYLALGLFPFLSLLKKGIQHLDIRKNWVSALCGIVVTGAQLVSGASGPLLDIFYIRSSLSRHEIIANKALTQTLGHGLKLFYYVSVVLSLGEEVKLMELSKLLILFPFMAVASFLGTLAGTFILKRIDENQFRLASQIVILSIGVFFLYRSWVNWNF